MKKIVGILTCCAMLLCASSAFAAANYIDVGDASSESGVCALTNALDPETRVVDGVTHTYRRLD